MEMGRCRAGIGEFTKKMGKGGWKGRGYIGERLKKKIR